jgi:hypothetical protein
MARRRRTTWASIVSAAALALVATACGGTTKHPQAAGATTSTTAVTPATAAGHARTATAARRARRHRHGRRIAAHRVAYHGPPLCPLNGLPAPNGHVPRRAALAVKVENLPQARPQWGLDNADIVFEEPVEGGITRFIVVFQCHQAPRIEPIRSARLIDPGILEPLGHVLFAYSGAIQPVVDRVDAPGSLLEDVSAYKAPQAYWTDPARYAPHNFESSTAALWKAATTLHYGQKPPTPIFSYGRPVQGGTPASSVSIHFPLDVTTWTWDPRTGVYNRSYSDTGPGLLGDGRQITASNVVVMLMHEYVTKYSEDPLGAHEYGLIMRGSGPAWVFRDGAVFYGHWERSKLDHPYVFIEKKNGAVIRLAPGNTWEELVPQGLDVAVQP